jgi:acetyltransferase
MPDLAPATQAVLVDALEKPTLLGNPLDVENLLKQDETAFYRCLDAFVSDPGLSVITARLNLPSSVTPEMRQAYAHLAHAAAEHHKQAVFFSRASEPLSPEWLDLFEELEVPLLKEYRKGLRTLRRSIDYGAFLERRRSSPLVEDSNAFDVDEACARASVTAGSKMLGYRATAAVLTAYGIPVAPARLVSTVEDACAAARELGWPIALKVASPDIPHKSDVGALALDLTGDSELEAAYARILDNARREHPVASIEGVVVQAMVRGGTETIVGLSVDPQLGPVVMFGLGGVFVEVLRDVAMRVGPLTRSEARSLISEVRGAALLRGARGRPPADEEALLDVLVRVARLGYDLRDALAELDLNPLLVLPRGEGVLAVDALAVRR